MKRMITLALMAVAMLTAQAQDNKYQARFSQIEEQGKALYEEYRTLATQETAEATARKEKIEQQLEELEQQQCELVVLMAKENRDSQLAVPYIKEAAYSLSFEQLTDILDPTAAYYTATELDKVKKLYEGMKKRQPGQPFHELTMDNLDGTSVNLSQWAGKGNYVMIDFWASWCGPCRQEMPNVVANYEKYHGKGLEIVGVSFDQKKEAWVNAVQQLGMTWPQMSDLKGWKSAAAEAYGIFSIPSSVLLDPAGNIVATNLRGAALGAKLKEIYGE